MQRQDIRHHTAEEIEQYAEQARDVARRVFEHPEDQAAVLPTLIGLFAAKQILLEQVQPSPLLAGMGRR